LPRTGNEHCLDHDSYLELRGVIEIDEYELDEAMRWSGNHLGRLSSITLRLVIDHVTTARQLPPEQRDRIVGNLTAIL
jgi:hypothetical protein